jgi:predicted nucleic acid-binding protein
MAANVVVDAGFLVALLTDRDSNHRWSIATAESHPAPWTTCDAVISESFYLLGRQGVSPLIEILRRGTVRCAFPLDRNMKEVLSFMLKYVDVPMSFADACLVRMTETLPDPILLTTDRDFRIYRRHGRQVIPCKMPD